MCTRLRVILATSLTSIALVVIGYWLYLYILKLLLWMPLPQLLIEYLRDVDRRSQILISEIYFTSVQFLIVATVFTVISYFIGRYTRIIYWLSLTLGTIYLSFIVNWIRSLDLNDFLDTPKFDAPPINLFWFELVPIVLIPLLGLIAGRKAHNKRFNSDAGKSRAG